MILLDTHVWIWWVSGTSPLTPAARECVERHVQDRAVHVSSISVWEVARLVARKRLELTMDVEDWVAHSEALSWLRFVPVDNRLAIRSTRLPPPLHADPADRIIVATARSLGATLITRDDRLRNYPHVKTLW